MFKQLTTGVALMISAIAFSQVGIGTETPAATLDVVGIPAEPSELDGIIAPRITGDQLRAKTYTNAQKGALVYVIAADTAPDGQTENVTAVGYYYFDGVKWQITSGKSENIYNTDGSLTDDRYVDLNGNRLNFQGFEGHTTIDNGGASVIIESESADRAQLRFFTQDEDGDGVSSNFDIDLFSDDYLQMFGNDEVNGIAFGTHQTQNASSIEFSTSPGDFADGETRMTITGEGNIGINTSDPENLVHIAGNGTDDPVRIEGLKPGTGVFVVADEDGVLRTTPDRANLPFVLPAVSNTTGLSLPQSGETGPRLYVENSAPMGSIMPGGGSWTKIPGMEITFDILETTNTISMSVEGMAQYNGDQVAGTAISFAIGIFVDNKLSAVRLMTLDGTNFNYDFVKWNLLGQVSDLALGSHKIEVYATRRNSAASADGDPSPTGSLLIARPATSATNLNQFMAKAVLQVNGVYH